MAVDRCQVSKSVHTLEHSLVHKHMCAWAGKAQLHTPGRNSFFGPRVISNNLIYIYEHILRVVCPLAVRKLKHHLHYTP